ncbi:hypothetical protein HOD88_03520 [archaeon]|jgi:hypothetical protein|nr:hypothetical protein [archaeon]
MTKTLREKLIKHRGKVATAIILPALIGLGVYLSGNDIREETLVYRGHQFGGKWGNLLVFDDKKKSERGNESPDLEIYDTRALLLNQTYNLTIASPRLGGREKLLKANWNENQSEEPLEWLDHD